MALIVITDNEDIINLSPTTTLPKRSLKLVKEAGFEVHRTSKTVNKSQIKYSYFTANEEQAKELKELYDNIEKSNTIHKLANKAKDDIKDIIANSYVYIEDDDFFSDIIDILKMGNISYKLIDNIAIVINTKEHGIRWGKKELSWNNNRVSVNGRDILYIKYNSLITSNSITKILKEQGYDFGK